MIPYTVKTPAIWLRRFPIIVAAVLFVATAGPLPAQSFTFAQFKTFSREYPGIATQNFGALQGSVPHGFLQSEAFQAIKAKTPLAEFPQSLQPLATPQSRLLPHALAISVIQPGTPTAVPELPGYAVIMGFATLAYVMIRRRGRFDTHPLSN
jgi:hypothetical protein